MEGDKCENCGVKKWLDLALLVEGALVVCGRFWGDDVDVVDGAVTVI